MKSEILVPMFVILLFLKLTNVITWSWWIVTAPLWAPFAIIFGIVAFAFFVSIIAAIVGSTL